MKECSATEHQFRKMRKFIIFFCFSQMNGHRSLRSPCVTPQEYFNFTSDPSLWLRVEKNLQWELQFYLNLRKTEPPEPLFNPPPPDLSFEPPNSEESSLASSKGELTLNSIFKSILDKPSQLDLPSIRPLHGGLTSNEATSDYFSFETDFDPSSFEDHILSTSEYLRVVDSEYFEEENSISILEKISPSAIVGVIQENSFVTLHLRPSFLISTKTSMRNFSLLILKLQILPIILPVWFKLQLKLLTLTRLKLLLYLRWFQDLRKTSLINWTLSILYDFHLILLALHQKLVQFTHFWLILILLLLLFYLFVKNNLHLIFLTFLTSS